MIALLTRTRAGQGRTADRGTQILLWIVIFLSMTAAGFLKELLPFTLPRLASFIAPYVLAAGLLLRWFAVWSLGKAFSANVAIRSSQRLNDTGLYSIVRHPSYSALLIIFLAVGLHSKNWPAFACAVGPTAAALLYRIRVEERALISAFGHTYEDYRRRTRCLIPGLY